jgi:hypothetical protein
MALSSRRLALSAIAIAGLVSCACIVTAIVLTRPAEDEQAQLDSSTKTPAPPEHLSFGDLNFRFAHPPEQWAQVEARQINPDSVLAFVSRQPEMAFIALADAPGIERQADLETFKEIVLSNHKSLWQSVELRDTRPETHSGVAGERLVLEVAGEQKKLTYVTWLGAHQGYVYQLQVFSSAADAAALNRAGDDMFARFALVDPKRVAHSDNPIDDFHSPRHGYALRLAGTLWQPWDNLREVLPDAEFGATIGNYARCAVIPMSFLGNRGWKP